MPSSTTSKLPVPKSWDEFEDIVVDLIKKEWGTPHVFRCGRQGQAQKGVDIYGSPAHVGKGTAGVQCKNAETLSWSVVRDAVAEAQAFQPKLAEFVIVTTAPSDAALQEKIRIESWPFPVYVRFWGDLSLALSGHTDLLEKHYPAFAQKRSSQDEVRALLYSCEPTDFSTQFRGEDQVLVCKKDVRFCIVHGDDPTQHRDFREPWIDAFPANNPGMGGTPAIRQRVTIEFQGTTVWSRTWVFVDGVRFLMPLPRSAKNLVIDAFQHHLARILNLQYIYYTVTSALDRAGITLVPRHDQSDEEWLPDQ